MKKNNLLEGISGGVSLAELNHGRRLLCPDDAEVELYQLNTRFGELFRHWLVFANENYFVVQELGGFELYETERFSYRFVNKKKN